MKLIKDWRNKMIETILYTSTFAIGFIAGVVSSHFVKKEETVLLNDLQVGITKAQTEVNSVVNEVLNQKVIEAKQALSDAVAGLKTLQSTPQPTEAPAVVVVDGVVQ